MELTLASYLKGTQRHECMFICILTCKWLFSCRSKTVLRSISSTYFPGSWKTNKDAIIFYKKQCARYAKSQSFQQHLPWTIRAKIYDETPDNINFHNSNFISIFLSQFYLYLKPSAQQWHVS